MGQLERSETFQAETDVHPTSASELFGRKVEPDLAKSGVRLIVNADDLGLSESINEAILRSHQEGIVTSASLLVNMESAARAAKEVVARGTLDVGLHFNLTQGHPVSHPSDIPSLVTKDGEFHTKEIQFQRLAREEIQLGDIRRELTAQVAQMHALGLSPVHVDGHQGAQLLPVVERVLLELGSTLGLRATRTRLGLPLLGPEAGPSDRIRRMARSLRALPENTRDWSQRNRSRRAGLRTGDGQVRRMRLYPQAADARSQLLARVLRLPPGDWELVLHPGPIYGDQVSSPKYSSKHGEDTRLATDPSIRALIASRGIELISYRALR